MCRVYLHAAETSLPRQAGCPREGRGQLTYFVHRQFRAAQTGQIKRAGAFGGAGGWIGKRTGVAKLQPKLGAVFAASLGKFGEPVEVGGRVEYQVAGLLGVSRIALHLADDG